MIDDTYNATIDFKSTKRKKLEMFEDTKTPTSEPGCKWVSKLGMDETVEKFDD